MTEVCTTAMPTRVRFSLTEPATNCAPLLFGVPFNTPEQSVIAIDVVAGNCLDRVTASNSGQSALLIEPEGGCAVVDVDFSDAAGMAPAWLFGSTGGAHEQPSVALAELIDGLAGTTYGQARVNRIIEHIDARFVYGRRERGLGDGEAAMPALLCDTHAGTCVDTHSYAVAAMRAGNMDAAYISGVFFKAGQSLSRPGHCWIAVQVDGAAQYWDVSHHLKYGLGPSQPGYNPLPGTRFALTAGRDLRFELPGRSLAVSILKGFVAADGEQGLALPTTASLI